MNSWQLMVMLLSRKNHKKAYFIEIENTGETLWYFCLKKAI
jgi:hypothetical protein